MWHRSARFTIRYVTNYTRHLVVHFAIQKAGKGYVCIIHFFVYLTPTGLMFPRVIDLNSHPLVVQSSYNWGLLSTKIRSQWKVITSLICDWDGTALMQSWTANTPFQDYYRDRAGKAGSKSGSGTFVVCTNGTWCFMEPITQRYFYVFFYKNFFSNEKL
jgi:hypothetical protein